ncbi:MAG: hypothetical protein HY744_05680 [Deltaproteobacteria bacterium]|nr:hypothetical protein [Deltaproteobacteria bacterium]
MARGMWKCVRALLGLALLATGCAEERAPISRIQAGALGKSFFVGQLGDDSDNPEFYMRTSVVYAAVGAGADGLFTSSDSQPTVRVRWEISEELLLARLAYELVADTDFKGARRAADGQIVAAYAVQKHFDIRRDYNPSTGEEYNVVVENDTDRPWYQREYFRVDWSRNLVTDAYDLDTLAQLGIYYGVKWDPVAYYVSQPDDPDAPVLDRERGYFDVTNKALAAPQVIEDEYWGDFPACWLLGSFPEVSCNPSEITLRQSFLRVADTDYEPADWDGKRMELFGYFTLDRQGYDRRYGVVDDKWHRFAARWNIWHRSHPDPVAPCAGKAGVDPHRDVDPADGTEDECAAVGPGARCDELRGECTIPYRDRKIRTIPWHVNTGFPEELLAPTAEALRGWSDAIRIAVVAARLAECRRTGGAGCEQEMGWPQPWHDDYVPPVGSSSAAQVPEIFVLCHNPVDPAKGDGPPCGAAGTRPRLGDLRYNFIAVIQDPEYMRPWGIMVDAEDPLSVQKIAGSVNMWGASLDRASATLTDLVLLLQGLIDPDTYVTGQSASDWVKANQPGGPAERGGAPMSAGELASRRQAFDPAVVERYLAGAAAPAQKKMHPRLRRQQRLQELVDQGRLGPGNAVLFARLRELRGSEVEAAMVSPEIAQAAGYDPTGPISAEAVRRGSPLWRSNPTVRQLEEHASRLGQARRHACKLRAPEPDNLLGMARAVQQLFSPPEPGDAAGLAAYREKIYGWARIEFTKGVFAHELGHSMGLRHNFAASFDALSYAPQYWQLRTRNGTLTQDCKPGTTDGAECVGPRWRDPLSDEETQGNIPRYATSSVMDYPGDQNQDMRLPGAYDRAAVRFGYGGVADVWAEDGVNVTGQGAGRKKAYWLTAFGANPGLTGIYFFPPVDPDEGDYALIHYSQYQKHFGLLADCQPDSSPEAVLGQRCRGPALDPVDYRDLQDWVESEYLEDFAWAYVPKAVDLQGRVRRGYLFSSDEYADAGNVPTFTDDYGADAYEIVRFLEGQYENRYLLDAFRRERVPFNSWDVTARIQSRYLDNIEQVAKTFAFGALLDGDPSQPSEEFLADGYYGPLALAGTVALDMFGRIMTRPEPGYYLTPYELGSAQPYGVEQDLHVADPAPDPEHWGHLYDFRVRLGEGRYLHNDYDYTQYYWWGDYQTQVGAYYEKIWATYYLAEAFDYFISNAKEDFTDSRYKNVNFATVFPEQVRRLYAALLTGDYESYAPYVVPPPGATKAPVLDLQYPLWHALSDPAPRPEGALLVDPNYAWNEQIYAMVWGAMFFPTNWSNGWVHEARIIATPPSEKPEWPGAETYVFYYPPTAVTYYAHGSGTEQLLGRSVQRGAGARMLAWANRLLTYAYVVERDEDGQPVLQPDGRPILVLDEDGKAQKDESNPGASGVLQAYVDTVDLMRQLTFRFAMPLGDGDLPQP